MKRTKKAFTVVELVIVIAVIAVLAAVLIPTFSGIIQDAHIRADESHASSFTTAIAMEMKGKKITSDAQLKEIYEKTFGEGTYANLQAKSASHGTYYWFDLEQQRVILATLDGVQKIADERRALEKFSYVTPLADGAGAADSISHTFNPLRELVDEFIYLDGGGSAFAEVLNEIPALNGGDDFVNLFTKLESVKGDSESPVKKMAEAATQKLKETVVYADSGIGYSYTGEDAPAEKNYYMPETMTKVDIVKDQNGDVVGTLPKPSEPIRIPTYVTSVESAALKFKDEDIGDIVIEVNEHQVPKQGESEGSNDSIFKADATNVTITVKGNASVTVDILDDEVVVTTKTSEGEATVTIKVEYSIPLAHSFEVSGTTNVEKNVNSEVAGYVYVNIDYAGEIQLKADNFKDKDGKSDVYSKEVVWSADETLVEIDSQKGVVKLKKEAFLGKNKPDEVVVTAKATKGGATATITLYVVKVDDFFVKMGDTTLATQNAIDYKLTTPKSYNLTVVPSYNMTAENLKKVGITPACVADASWFSVTGGFTKTGTKLEMKLDGTKPAFDANKKLSGTLTVTGLGITNSYTITFTDKSECPLTLNLANTNKYLYFLGNEGEIALSSLFKLKDGYSLSGDVTIKVIDVVNSAEEEQTVAVTTDGSGLAKTIDFPNDFTGPVTIEVMADGMPITLDAKVVAATNVTTYSELKNQSSVLLNDITMSANSSYYLSNGTLYGNGFTFDVTKGAYSGTGGSSNNYLIGLSNANLDNIKVIGAVYTVYGGKAADDYSRATVFASGVSRITNAYISNCAVPLRVGGTIHVENVVLKGGILANLEALNGNLTLKNLTTINQANLNDKADDGSTIVGLGIVISTDSKLATNKITIEGTLNQYNYISENQKFENNYATAFSSTAFGSAYSDFHYTDGSNVKWLNAGIVSMNDVFGASNLNDGTVPSGYIAKSASIMGVSGYVWSVTPDANKLAARPKEWAPTAQAPVAPTYEFEYPTEAGKKNYLAKKENDFCNYEGGKIYISMDKGDTYVFDPAILTVNKHGNTLGYAVTMGGVSYTNQTISFNAAGNYTLVYSYTDAYHYELASGVIASVEKTYTHTVEINVVVVEPQAKHAEFTFNGTAGEKVAIGDKTYITPKGVTAASSTWGSVTVEGQAIYFPIVAAYVKTEANKNERCVYFPILKGTVTIVDYADKGLGAAVTYGDSITTMPDGLSLVKGRSSSAQGTSSLDSSKFVTTDGTWTTGVQNVFLWSADINKNGPSADPTQYNSALCYATGSGLSLFSNNAANGRNGMNYWIVQYKYIDNSGTPFYYYVGYYANCYQEKEEGCFAEGTMITLADGTQKPIEQITYEDTLLAWDFMTGEYVATVPALIEVGMPREHRVLNLYFADGTTVRVIDHHGFFDVATNNYVFLDETNVASYVGNSFVKVAADGGYTDVELTGYSVTEETVRFYTILTAFQSNCIAEGMFTLTPPPGNVEGYYDWFEIGEGMKYDEAKMQADIEAYGLYTYEDFADYVTYEQFIAFNGPYLKVLVGKGIVTFEEILVLIGDYVNQ